MEATNGRRDQLIERRRRLGYTQESFAHEVGVSPFTVAQWERGNVTPRPRYRPALAEALGVGVADVERLLDPHTVPVLTGHSVPNWLNHYESLVHAAAVLRNVELVVIPGLLQTPAYAAVLERTTDGPGPTQMSGDRVERRMRRKEVLLRDEEPLRLTALIPHRVLEQRVGSERIMAEQLRHLEVMDQRSNIEILVLPPDGSDALAVSSFELLTSNGAAAPFIACTFDVGGARYHEDSHLIERFEARYEQLRSRAAPLSSVLATLNMYRENFQ